MHRITRICQYGNPVNVMTWGQEFSKHGMAVIGSLKCRWDFPWVFFLSVSCVVLIARSGLLCTAFLHRSQYRRAELYTTVGCPACSCGFPGKQFQPSCSFNPLWVLVFMSHLPPVYTLWLLFMPPVKKHLKQANRLLASRGPVILPHLWISFFLMDAVWAHFFGTVTTPLNAIGLVTVEFIDWILSIVFLLHAQTQTVCWFEIKG